MKYNATALKEIKKIFQISAEVPGSLMGLPDFKSGVGR